jgi:hypothetical protein
MIVLLGYGAWGMGHGALDLLAFVLFALLGKRVKVKGERDFCSTFSPAPYPQRGPHLPPAPYPDKCQEVYCRCFSLIPSPISVLLNLRRNSDLFSFRVRGVSWLHLHKLRLSEGLGTFGRVFTLKT